MKIKYPSRQDEVIRPAVTADIDRTILTDKLMPKSWKCPHCDKRNKSGMESNEILMNHFKVIEQCRHCGYLHIWELELTEDFKKKVIAMILN